MDDDRCPPSTGTTGPNRRRVLAALGGTAATGFAGCLGGGGDGDGNSTDGDGGGNGDGGGGGNGGSGGSTGCADLGSDYTTLDPGQSMYIFTCEYPALFGDISISGEGSGSITVNTTPQSGGRNRRLVIQQGTSGMGTDVYEERQFYSDEKWEAVASVEFGGESMTAYRNTNPDVSTPNSYNWEMFLPHDSRYYSMVFNLAVGSDPEVSEECVSTLENAAVHLTESLAPNPDTTT